MGTEKNVDPLEGLAADATLATDLGDEDERVAQQLEYYGGEKDDDIDDFDATGLDDGSDLDYTPPEKDDDDGESSDDKDGSDAEGDEEKDGETDDSDSDEDDDSEDDDSEGGEADEDEGDEEDGDEGEDEGDPDPKPAPKGIPKHRFDQVNERAKAAEAELATLKAENAAKVKGEEDTFDFDAAEKEYLDLSLDGDVDAALAKRKEIRAAERAEWKAETKAETKSETAVEQEESELYALSQEAEKMFTVFDPDHEDYDQDMLNKVLVYYRGYAASGEAASKGDAFVMGLADVVEQYGLDNGEASEGDSTPEKKPTGKRKTDKTKEKTRKKAHTPIGADGDGSADVGAVAPDIDQMSDEELDALPEKTLARMRGDFI